MQQCPIESQKRARSAEIAHIIEVGCNAGHNQHRRSISRQMLLASTRKRQRRQCMSDRFHARILTEWLTRAD